MMITTSEFNPLVEDLVNALHTHEVPGQEENELLGLLGPMKKDIVELPEHESERSRPPGPYLSRFAANNRSASL